ncbi:putative disease resistance protein RGA4 [Curcuma longa]|uniref:putative disease resistance protein RGA4 n=1 Tax=Curcuma longa TaxID=136217 RepID=UPI003D9E4C52
MEAALVATARFAVDKVAILVELDEKLKAMTGTKRKMEKLKDLSTNIDMVIQDVESHPLNKDAVKDLLRKLKYLAYDLEDVVDYYDTKVLQKKQRSKTFLRPVRDFFSSDNEVVFKSRVGDMIKAITGSLDYVLLQKSIILNLPQGSIRMSEPSLYRETHSRNSFVVIGREPEKNMIVNMLTNDDDDDESSHSTLKVIVIVGMGGLGKTTLAQFVFNDERVKAHFESSRMWTVVGAEFDPAKIMKSVLEAATDAPVNISQIDSVRKKIEEVLSGKKFLLVLDDVWNEDPLKWGVLKAALTCGARGSKILVTTRSQQVSLIMGSSNTTHQIQQLSPANCLSLFQQFAFGDQAVDPILMKISGKIVKKCGGVPLAAISLGNMLCGTRDETYWSSVLKSEIWQLRDEEQKVLAVLKWSYDTLPPRSKKCFAFGSLFSKNHRMTKDGLIKLWIANGFVCSDRNFDAETLGNHVFDDLVKRSFFLLAPPLAYSQVTECTMHDLMHDLARSVSADAYWNSYQDSVEDIRNRTYHLQIVEGNLPDMTRVLGKKPLYLRTFMSKDTFSRLSITLLEVFSELKFLRTLDLTNGGIREVPTSIGNLIHLRYLNLSKNKIEVLPDSITLLSNLQYLNLSFNRELQELPKDFNKKLQELPKELGNMQNLQELDLQSGVFGFDFRLTHIPCGLSQLTNLRSLPLFIASDKIGTCSIIELEDLKLLHGGMKIKFSEDFNNYPCGGRKILKNNDLTEVCIEFNDSERYDKDMLDDLCPNTNLKKLTIQQYGSRQFPAWLMESQLPNLVEVNLENCSGCEHIPPFGNLQFLKKLCLQSMAGITQMGADFHGYRGFPSLQELCLSCMYDLEEWLESHDDDELFPSLQRLQVDFCTELKSMPRLPRIQELEISYCSGSILSYIGRLTSLSILRVKEMHDMTSLPSGCIRNLTSLTELEITDCRQLQYLPGDELQYPKMIRSLTIERCDKLASFPSKVRHLSSLCFLRIFDCPSITLQPEELVQILNSVHEFQIEICGNKVDLHGSLQQLHTLRGLSLIGAHDVSSIYKYTELYPRLRICCCDKLESLMIVEPASSVLQELYIDGIFNLTTLPDWLQHLKSLRVLSIQNCPRLERMPRGLKNLHMLKTLKIIGCPQLARRCQRETGEDWEIISYVPYVHM